MPRLPEGPLGYDQLGFVNSEVTLLGIIDGKSVPIGPNIPARIRGRALIVQTADGIKAIPAPRVNLETMEINVFDFNQLEPGLKESVLNALSRSRKIKRQRIGQATSPNQSGG